MFTPIFDTMSPSNFIVQHTQLIMFPNYCEWPWPSFFKNVVVYPTSRQTLKFFRPTMSPSPTTLTMPEAAASAAACIASPAEQKWPGGFASRIVEIHESTNPLLRASKYPPKTNKLQVIMGSHFLHAEGSELWTIGLIFCIRRVFGSWINPLGGPLYGGPPRFPWELKWQIGIDHRFSMKDWQYLPSQLPKMDKCNSTRDFLCRYQKHYADRIQQTWIPGKIQDEKR